jgi:aryl-alcohol dehydrogenase-like predicted oxidoreductase
LNELLDMGITYFDTAPAYGLSEERLGKGLGHRRNEFILSTKVGENFENGKSEYDFTEAGIRASIARSLRRLRTDHLDIVLIHSNGNDLEILQQTDVVATLCDLKQRGLIRAIGLSGKLVEGARAALAWADAIMVEYHTADQSHAEVIAAAARQGVGVIVKKGLASGNLAADEAIRFVLENAGVASLVIGGLNAGHMRANLDSARHALAALHGA